MPALHLFSLEPPGIAYTRNGETRRAVFVGTCFQCFRLYGQRPLACPCDTEILVHERNATRGKGHLLV